MCLQSKSYVHSFLDIPSNSVLVNISSFLKYAITYSISKKLSGQLLAAVSINGLNFMLVVVNLVDTK